MPLRTGDPLPGRPDGLPWREGPAGPLVIYFYPRDFTSVCTRQACEFREVHDAFRRDYGAELVGISRDSEERHARFRAEHRLPFRLLSDRSGELSRRFGVTRFWGLLPIVKRVTFVADAADRIRGVFHHELDPSAHVRDVRSCLAGLDAPRRPA